MSVAEKIKVEKKEIIQDFLWNYYLSKIDKNNPFEISKFEKTIRNLFVKIKDVTLKKYITDNLAGKFSKLTPNLNTSNFKKRNFKNKTVKQPSDSALNAINDKTILDEDNMKILRKERNNKLAETDWVVIKEREEGGSVSNFADWKKYRQELRDITKTYKSLEDVKWPTAPSE